MSCYREIKFRAWDDINKQIIEPEGLSWGGFYLDMDTGQIYQNANTYKHMVPCEFISMQYTGMSDKHGKEIYEGDIVIDLNEEEPDNRYFIQYHICDEICGWALENHNEVLPLDNTKELQVIGNIYENLELLVSHLEKLNG